jgi:hydrogenase maturation protease
LNILLIAIGNSYRRDDGVAHRALELLGPPPPGVSTRSVLQLTPEMAEEIAPFDCVVFLDADIEPGEPRLERISLEAPAGSPLGHSMSAQEVLALATSLYNFRGQAWLYRIPGIDFGEGSGLSELAEANAVKASCLLTSLHC